MCCQVVYNFSLPYEASVQADGLTYPVHVWKDHHTSSMRMDTYGWNSLVTVQVSRECGSRCHCTYWVQKMQSVVKHVLCCRMLNMRWYLALIS